MQQVAARAFADWIVDKVRTPAIPYVEGGTSAKGTDCINLIRWALRELTGEEYQRGSNSAWRKDMVWRGTIAEAKALGYLIPGAIVYICYGDSAKWNDEWGAMDHSGVYVGFDYGLKNPDGKPADVVHASSSRNGVYGSILAVNAWTHVALHIGVLYAQGGFDYGSDDDGAVEAPVEEPAEVPGANTDNQPVAQPEPEPGEVMVNTKETGVRMRKEPKIVDGKNHNRICEVPKGTILTVLERRNGWTKVPYTDQRGTLHRGWIRDDFLKFG